VPAGDGLSEEQRRRLGRAVADADAVTGLHFRVRVGSLDAGRATATEALAELGGSAADTVLVAVDPARRTLEIVTGPVAASSIDDRSCALASLAMTSSFAAGDLVGGLVNGLQVLADHGRRMRVLNLERA
jgi:uncharacterized membrane protein YgcG